MISFCFTDGEVLRQVDDPRVPRPGRSHSSSCTEPRVLDYARNTEFFHFSWKADGSILISQNEQRRQKHSGTRNASPILKKSSQTDRQTDKAFAGSPSEVGSPLQTERVDNTSYFMKLHFPQGRHLPYGYEISFADSIRLDANVHKVFFALERSRIWTLRHGNWANSAVTHRSLYLKCKHDKQSVDTFLCLVPQLFSPNKTHRGLC